MKDPIADPLTPARKEVILAIKLIGEPTVEQLGEHLGLSVSTLRAHLLSLEAARLIGHQTEGQGPGRRRHRYFLTQLGEDLFPSENSGLVSVLTQLLLRAAPQELEQKAPRPCRLRKSRRTDQKYLYPPRYQSSYAV